MREGKILCGITLLASSLHILLSEEGTKGGKGKECDEKEEVVLGWCVCKGRRNHMLWFCG